MNVGFWISRDENSNQNDISISSDKPTEMNDIGLWVIKEPVMIMSDLECLAIFGILPDEGSCEYYTGVIKRAVK